MRKLILSLAALAFLSAACGGKPEAKAEDLLKKGDRVAAQAELEKLKADKPDRRETRYLLFNVYRYLKAQGDPKRSDFYLQAAIGEYGWICQTDGVTLNYQDMEGSLKANEKSRPLFEAAYAAVYGR
jgi:hypothetical protein